MFTIAILADVQNSNLIFGFMPESFGLLLFGIILIVFAVSLRRLFNRRKNENGGEK
jgi:hypothetical protein